ncbi:MAG TPA: LiaF domain-containing protein [Gemmatimonadaceae bacterium]|nr:LiaF domain-containing protein [Gemmatimonadaceae bacterium]
MTQTTPPALPARVAPPVVIPPELVPDRRGAVAFLSSINRRGDWILPREFRIVSFMGNVELDLTSVRIGPGESRIEIRCVWGNVEITVPPDIRVEIDGRPVMGTFEIERSVKVTPPPDAPLVRITGSAVMGAVTINIVDPNAPSWLEKLAAKWAGGA